MTAEQKREAKLATQKRWRERHRLLTRARSNARTAERRRIRLAALVPAPVPVDKQCACCLERKAFDLFGTDRARKDGHDPYCKACKLAKSKASYLRHRVLRPRAKVVRSLAEVREMQRRSRERVPADKKRNDVNRWKANNPERYRVNHLKHQNSRRARKASVFVEHVDPVVVYERDGGVCGVCAVPVKRNEKWHIDHVIPISRGGVHAYSNVQLAHAICNLKKGARVAA
jgi:5-methylcytosine-specific restriction endonuclease McrA